MPPNPVVWFEIYVQDMPRAKAFYEAVFQCQLNPLPNPDAAAFPDMEMLAFPSAMDGYGASGALVKMPGCPVGGSGTLVYLGCNDCAEEAARAASNGGRVFRGKTAIGAHGFIALVHDPEGNLIGLHSMA